MDTELLVAGLTAFALTSLLLWILEPVARHIGLVDHPGGRKTHSEPTPLVGGIAMFIALRLLRADFHCSPLELSAALCRNVDSCRRRRARRSARAYRTTTIRCPNCRELDDDAGGGSRAQRPRIPYRPGKALGARRDLHPVVGVRHGRRDQRREHERRDRRACRRRSCWWRSVRSA